MEYDRVDQFLIAVVAIVGTVSIFGMLFAGYMYVTAPKFDDPLRDYQQAVEK